MSYVEKHLLGDESIVYQTQLNWSEYLKLIIPTFIGLFAFNFSSKAGFFIIGFTILMTIMIYLKIKTSEFIVTNKRVMIKVGIISTNSFENMLNKVEGIHVSQSIFGKIFKSGSISIKGTGGTTNPFHNINKPYEFRNAVNQQIENLKIT